MKTSKRWCSAAALLTISLGACGPAHPDLGTVTGTVTLNKQPLAGAGIVFQPSGGRPSYGMTDSAGRYALEYAQDVPGARIGRHTVIIRTRFTGDFPGDPKASPERLPKRYHDETELTADVKAGENIFDFDLTASPGEMPAKERPRIAS